MTVEEIIKAIAGLSEQERAQLLESISPSQASSSSESPRLRQLLDKQGRCPHCGGSRYYRFGRDKGAQRFRCHDCGRTFTEYTGTWQSGLHRRDLASRYLSLMSQNKSLDKISSELRINKKTAFDWRHKILGTFRQDRGEKRFVQSMRSEQKSGPSDMSGGTFADFLRLSQERQQRDKDRRKGRK